MRVIFMAGMAKYLQRIRSLHIISISLLCENNNLHGIYYKNMYTRAKERDSTKHVVYTLYHRSKHTYTHTHTEIMPMKIQA